MNVVSNARGLIGAAARICALGCAVVVLVLSAGALSGCAGPPSEPPSIRGVVSSADLSAGGTGSMLIEGQVEQDTTYDRATVAVTADTRIWDSGGTLIQATDIAVGSSVEAWFTGAVAESYPVQATASDLVMISTP